MDKMPQPSLLKGFVLRLRVRRRRAFVKHKANRKKKMPTSNTFSYVFRFEAQGEVTSSIQTLSLHMKFSIFLRLYFVDDAFAEHLAQVC